MKVWEEQLWKTSHKVVLSLEQLWGQGIKKNTPDGEIDDLYLGKYMRSNKFLCIVKAN